MGSYFCGWYFKCQSDRQTLALIPAIHGADGKTSGSLQILCDTGAWNVPLPAAESWVDRDRPRAVLGNNRFGPDGIRLNVQSDTCQAAGVLQFGRPTPLRYDIMGPFRWIPGLECRHSVFSMRHSVQGEIRINGVDYHFSDGAGYVEGDRGHSFPRHYLWTQCMFPGGSLMLSIAEVPLGPVRLNGIIGVVWLAGKEYRFATYLGARISERSGGRVTVCQGPLTLTAVLLEQQGHLLHAPRSGAMTRMIREAPACRAYYRLICSGTTVFTFESTQASFEYEYPQ